MTTAVPADDSHYPWPVTTPGLVFVTTTGTKPQMPLGQSKLICPAPFLKKKLKILAFMTNSFNKYFDYLILAFAFLKLLWRVRKLIVKKNKLQRVKCVVNNIW